MPMPHWKYRTYPTVDLPDRTWPDVVLDRPPIWCSTDLRDGNQALVEPMDSSRKQAMFDLLVHLGIKEIEVGFPSASKTDFDFVRNLIENELIPEDTTIAVLTQARPELIERTYEAIEGRRVRSSTSTTPPRPRSGESSSGSTRPGSPAWPCAARRSARSSPRETSTEIVFQYSPESFHATELDYALEICEAVIAVWEPSRRSR